jgi:hypothetical protein
MTPWLISALERLPPLARRGVIAVVALVLVGAAVTALTVAPSPGIAARPAPRAQRAPAHETASRPLSQLEALPAPPVPPVQLRRAREAAERFLSDYLPLAYGRGTAREASAVRAALGRRLARARALITPVERRRHPRVVSLRVVGMTPGFVVATAMVDDGGLSVYPLRFTLREAVGRRWVLSSVQEG